MIPFGMVPGGSTGYQIPNSVRLRSSASGNFQRTWGAPTNQNKFTISVWVKLGAVLSGSCNIFCLAAASGALQTSGGNIWFGSGSNWTNSNNLVRDPTAWYHIVATWDSSLAAASRAKIYLNGVECSYGSNNFQTGTNFNGNTFVHSWGVANTNGINWDGAIAYPTFIDGQALTPSSFGQADPNNANNWIPKAYAGTYGAQGSAEWFNDGTSATTLGYDRSGNGNNWTASGISTTAGVTYDWMTDTPTNNYATLNPLNYAGSGGITFADANLALTANNNAFTKSSIPITQKTYYEVTLGAAANSAGVMLMTTAAAAGTNSNSTDVWYYKDSDGTKYITITPELLTGRVIQVAMLSVWQ